MNAYHEVCHELPKATRRRCKAQTVHRCPCGDLFVVEAFHEIGGDTGYRWKKIR